MRWTILLVLGVGAPSLGCKEPEEPPAQTRVSAVPPTPSSPAAAPQAPQGLPPPPDVAAPPKEAKKTPSGLAYKVLKKGTGTRHPTTSSVVRVHYTGWTTEGRMFDSSVVRGQPIEMAVGDFVKGWIEALPLMVEGEKTRLWLPGKLAYGEGPSVPGGPPMGMLVFDVELLAIH